MSSSNPRKKISAPTEAALWALSNGRCYFPDCAAPVVLEVRPGVYRKNVQVAHIHGVAPGAARFKPMSEGERDGFRNLLLLCYAHHREIDNEQTGGQLYPADLLRAWKRRHEGSNAQALEALGPVDEDSLAILLEEAFEPPLKRLEAIADQLERTGTANAQTVDELRRIVAIMASTSGGPDARTAALLADAASVFSDRPFAVAVQTLADLTQFIKRGDLHASADELKHVASRIEEAIRRGSQFM